MVEIDELKKMQAMGKAEDEGLIFLDNSGPTYATPSVIFQSPLKFNYFLLNFEYFLSLEPTLVTESIVFFHDLVHVNSSSSWEGKF